MSKKTIAIVLICSMTVFNLATPVMALPLGGPLATAVPAAILADATTALEQLRSGDGCALNALLDELSPLLPPQAASYADDLRAAGDTPQAQDGMNDFLRYAGNVCVLMGVVAILAGILDILDGNFWDGVEAILLGAFFLVLGLAILAEVPAAPLTTT